MVNRGTPKRVVISIGYSCVNDCKFCVVAEKRSLPDKTTAVVKQELKEAYDGYARDVVFTGGECTARKDIVELVAYARKLGFPVVNIQTNGRAFASLDFCKRMLLAGMTSCQSALHGHTAALHDDLVGSPGAFRQTVLGLHNLRKLCKGKFHVSTNTVVVKQNYRYLPQLVELVIGLKVNHFQFAFVHAMGNAATNIASIVPRKSKVAPYIHRALDLAVGKKITATVEAVPYCFMAGYEDYIVEPHIPSTELREAGGIVPRFEDIRVMSAKVKFPQCRDCRYDAVCEGPWKEYPAYYGASEFKPVRS